MKETYNFLQTYEICFKLIYLKLLQEYFNNEIIRFTDKLGEEETVYYTVTDIQGSITEVYDNDSNLVWKSGYTAFGELAGETVDLIDFDGMYIGCDYDAEIGLTYHWNRWRSEDGSCFISEDPIRDGTNWYGYAGQNPMVYVDPTGLAPYINGIYDGDYNPDYNPGVPVEGPKTQEQQKYYEPQGPTALPNSLDFRIEPIYNFYGDFVGYGAEGEQRAEAFEKTQFFYFHFEGRNKRNIITETFDEIYNSSQSKNGDWILLDYNMSLLHQNEIGSAELKFICKDGREAVFTKDFSKDGSYELYTDPRYVGTFNYCNPVPAPKGISDVKGLFNFIGKSIIGHGCLDVIPYYVTGKRNVRDSAKIVK